MELNYRDTESEAQRKREYRQKRREAAKRKWTGVYRRVGTRREEAGEEERGRGEPTVTSRECP